MNQTIILRYIWFKIISQEWKPGTELPSANTLAHWLKQKPSTVKAVLKKFIINNIIITYSRSKMIINPALCEIFPFSVESKYDVKAKSCNWIHLKNHSTIQKIYDCNKNAGEIILNLSIFDNKINIERLQEQNKIIDILFLLTNNPNWLEITTKTTKTTIVKNIKCFDERDLIIFTVDVEIPLEVYFDKKIWNLN